MKILLDDIKARLLNGKYKNENYIGKLIFGTIMIAQLIVLFIAVFVTILDCLISFFWHHRELGNKEFWIVALGLSTLFSSMLWIDMIFKTNKEHDEQFHKMLHFHSTWGDYGSKTREEAEKYVSTCSTLNLSLEEKDLLITGFMAGVKHRRNIEDGEI